ncbi:MAG: hypothetical protein AAGA54_07895 [Myxococcota bacterium]
MRWVALVSFGLCFACSGGEAENPFASTSASAGLGTSPGTSATAGDSSGGDTDPSGEASGGADGSADGGSGTPTTGDTAEPTTGDTAEPTSDTAEPTSDTAEPTSDTAEPTTAGEESSTSGDGSAGDDMGDDGGDDGGAGGPQPADGMYSPCTTGRECGFTPDLCITLEDADMVIIDGFCSTTGCVNPAADCDANPGGTASPTCVGVTVDGAAENACMLDCTGGLTCPTGMTCYDVGDLSICG